MTPKRFSRVRRFERAVGELSLAHGGLFGSDAWMGNLGAELWRRFVVTLDTAAGMLHLEPRAALAQPFMAPCAGLVAPLRQGRCVVVDVVPGSPAAEAGVRLGDEVLALDGEALAGDAGRLRRALRGTPGSTLRLRLGAASDGEREATLGLRELV